jgi:cytochrome P450
MGAPLRDAPRLHHWSNRIQRQFDPASLMTEREQIARAVEEFYAYENELIAARRDQPADDLPARLVW